LHEVRPTLIFSMSREGVLRLILCMNSGFDREDEWGYRSMEPNRCCITSIALVLLKTGISQPDASSEEGTADHLTANDAMPAPPAVNVNSGQLATAQKLLLFWRKPAVGHAQHLKRL
jgi:hypothetical protein